MSEGIFSDLVEVNELDLSQILNNLIDGTKDVDLKSEILKPKQLASLKVLSDLLGNLDYKKSENMIKNFIETYLRYMFSYNRQSRKEIIKAIAVQLDLKSKNLSQKLVQPI